MVDAICARPLPVPIDTLWNPDTCPASLLPWLAWALSVDSWKSYWPEAVKRQRLRTAIAVQRRKGTVGSVREVVESFGGSIIVREWWETSPRGEPHTFEVALVLSDINGSAVSSQFIDDVIAEVARTKPVRSHFNFSQGIQSDARIGVVAAARAAVYRRIQLDGI